MHILDLAIAKIELFLYEGSSGEAHMSEWLIAQLSGHVINTPKLKHVCQINSIFFFLYCSGFCHTLK